MKSMFTGIVNNKGVVVSVKGKKDKQFIIQTDMPLSDMAIGASVACSGACMTVVSKSHTSFTIDVSLESLGRTTMGAWDVGTEINLERSLKVGDELGGHFVTGHVDEVIQLVSVTEIGECWQMVWRVSGDIAKYIAEKGSITIDGVSLTINEVTGSEFSVNIIPHTMQHTTLGALKNGGKANCEIDILARYIQKQLSVTR